MKILNQDVLQSEYQDEVIPFIMTSGELREETLLHIVSMIKKGDFEGKINAAMVLSELVDAGKNFKEEFRSKKVNENLFDLIYEKDERTKQSALQVLITLYSKFPFYQKDSEEEEDPFGSSLFNEPKRPSEDKILPHINDLLISHLNGVVDIIESENSEMLEQQYTGTMKRFGMTRIYAVQFMKSIISLGVAEYTIQFNSTFAKLLQFSKENQWNSALHKLTEDIFSEVLRSNGKYPDGFKTAFLEDSNLLQFIASLDPDTEMDESQRPMRAGYMGSFMILANILENSQSKYVKKMVDENPDWQMFK